MHEQKTENMQLNYIKPSKTLFTCGINDRCIRFSEIETGKYKLIKPATLSIKQ